MQLPLVTIQIPTYNQKAYIKEALDSALAQSYENLQIIISDDCSPDYDIFEYLKEYKNNPKVLIHRNAKNIGRVANYRNTLYNLVKGEWFVNLDGDDYFINPDFIKNAIDYIQHTDFNPVVFQGHTLIKNIKANQTEFKKIDENTYYINGIDYLKYPGLLCFTHGSLLYKTDSAKEVGFYKYDTLDTDWWSYLKIFKKGDIIFSNCATYVWRQHETQETKTLDFDKVYNKWTALEDVKKFYSTVDRNITQRIFVKSDMDIFAQLSNAFYSEKKSIRKFLLLTAKMKIKKQYIVILLSTLKRIVFLKLGLKPARKNK